MVEGGSVGRAVRDSRAGQAAEFHRADHVLVRPETVGGCLLLLVFGLLWLGWACLCAIGLVMETDGRSSWNAWVWVVVLITYVAAPIALFWGLTEVIKLGERTEAQNDGNSPGS
jgi:hypothetical protein